MAGGFSGLRTSVAAVAVAVALAAGACEKADSSGQANPPKPPTPASPSPTQPAAAPASRPATQPAVASYGRPSTQPGRIGSGDLLVVDVAELNGPGTSTPKLVRVEADGTVRLLYLSKPLPIAGQTTADAQLAIGKAYREQNLLQNAQVYVRRLQVGGDASAGGAVPAGPIGNFDLVQFVVWDLNGPGTETNRIVRVGPDGTVGLPYIGKLKLAGLTAGQAEEAIVQEFNKQNVLQHAMVSVLRLEAAPPDAARVDLPDAPIYPVPDLLRPYFEPGVSGPPMVPDRKVAAK